MPNNFNLQLLPERRKKIEVYRIGENRLLIVAIIVTTVILGLVGGSFLYKKNVINAIKAIDQEISDLDKARDRKSEDELLALSKRLAVAGTLLNSHAYWSEVFGKLQTLIQSQVSIKAFGGNIAEKKLSISGEVSGLPMLAKQLAAFSDSPYFSDISLGKIATLPTGRSEFSIQLLFRPDNFINKSQTP